MADEEQDGDTEFVDYDEDTISRIQAALAEKEKEALEAIKEDICHWLYDVLKPFNIAPQTFWDSLDTGVALCTLATLIQQTAQEVKKNFDFFVPMETLKCNHRAEPGTFFARDNASNFIDWCRKLGVEEAVIFESEGLVSHKDEKRVILCLLDVARFAEKVGMTAPQLIKMEREIEELEKAEKEDTHFKMTEDKHKSLSPSPVKMNPPPFSRDTCTQQEKDKKNQVSEQQEKAIPRPSRIPRRITRSTVKGVHSQLVSPTAKHTPRVPRKRARERESDCSELQTTWTKRLKTSSRGEGEGEVTSERKKETMDEKVMRRMGECHCEKRLEVTNCGKGKFIVKAPSGKNITLYARMLSDRVMVRVGGGWDTLDHFLLKHDPLIGPTPGLGKSRQHNFQSF